jgi:hypothetical protein
MKGTSSSDRVGRAIISTAPTAFTGIDPLNAARAMRRSCDILLFAPKRRRCPAAAACIAG